MRVAESLPSFDIIVIKKFYKPKSPISQGQGRPCISLVEILIPQRDVAHEGARNNFCPQNLSFRRGVHFHLKRF